MSIVPMPTTRARVRRRKVVLMLKSLFSRMNGTQERGVLCSCGRSVVGGQRMVIDPKTLRRRYLSVCGECHNEIVNSPKQKSLRRERTRRDWQDVTTPVNKAAIVANQMPEQYPGRAREALRAFISSDATRAVVPGVDMASMQTTISALGLNDQVYAEQRDEQTVVRRIVA